MSEDRKDRLRLKMLLHMPLKRGGYVFLYALVDHPGVSVNVTRESHATKPEWIFIFDGREYPTKDLAIAARDAVFAEGKDPYAT